MTAPPQASTPYEAVAAIDDAARYIAGHLAFHRLLETSDPDGWDLARRLAVLADTLGRGAHTSVWSKPPCPGRANAHDTTDPPAPSHEEVTPTNARQRSALSSIPHPGAPSGEIR
jgi:hypothetical protein